MKLKEITIIGFLLLGAFVTMFLPDTAPVKHIIGEKELLYEVNKEGRYTTTDEVAQMLIEKDPSLLLIDLRTPDEYNKYTIEGAINIPYNDIMKEDNQGIFDSKEYTTVLFSNGSSIADQAWIRLRSFDNQGNKVMKGGLNEWYRTILNPQKPKPSAPAKEVEQYINRKGASIFFTGAQVVGDAPKTTKKKASKPIIKRKKKEVSGGCG